MHKLSYVIGSVISLLSLSIFAQPVVVTINDVPNATPVVQVLGAPNGYEVYMGPFVSDPAIEDGALVLLKGLNNSVSDPAAALPDWAGRFLDSTPWQCLPPLYLAPPYDPNVNYRSFATAVDIVWVEHNLYVSNDDTSYGDLVVGFNSTLPGHWYTNPDFVGEDDLGPVTDHWVTVYANEVVVIRFKPHTYVAKGFIPYAGAVQLHLVQATPKPGGVTEQVLEGQGRSSQMGSVSVWAKIEIDEGEYDPSGPSWITHISGIEIETAANGDTITSIVQCTETVPLPVPTPFLGYISGTRVVTDGTGRFEGARGCMTLEGTDGSGGILLSTDGVLSTVGKNKK